VIDLFSRDDRTGFGIAVALETERIPHRRLNDPTQARGRVLVVARPDAPATLRAGPSGRALLAIGHGGPAVEALFDAPPASSDREVTGPTSLSLEAPVWPARARAIAASVGTTHLRLPSCTVRLFDPPAGTSILATAVTERGETPAVVARGDVCWVLADLGAALAKLLDESYRHPPAPTHPFPRPALAAYYRAPEWLRGIVQRRAYRRLEASLAVETCPSTYPVDPSGWLVLELLKALLARSAGPLVRLARWPAPFRAAATITHDVEPSRFAYRTGLRRLVDRANDLGYRRTFGIVARPASRHLSDRAALADADVVCHGLEHRGETLASDTLDAVVEGMTTARQSVRATTGRPVRGFRSPRLDRSPVLVAAVERAGFEFDSSYPDVDRESLAGFGGGVRLNLPYRPPVSEDGRVRASRCLEVPVSAPDCVQPLFAGERVEALRRAVFEKIEFVRASEGAYVAIVHPGVFGRRDSDRRLDHLVFVRDALRVPDVWLTSLEEMVDWWRRRERVAVEVDGTEAIVTNRGTETACGLRLEHDGSGSLALPPLAAGERVTVALASPALAAHGG